MAGAATSQAGSKPRTRQRIHKPPPTLDVPDIEEDSAERKRVLNVLAQRRYRERKRQDRLKSRGKGQEAEDQDYDHIQETSAGIASALKDSSGSHVGPSPSYSHPSTEGGVALMDLELTNWGLSNDELSSVLPDANAPIPDFTNDGLSMDDNFALSAFSVGSTTNPSISQFGSPSSFTNFSTTLSSSPSSEIDQFPDSFLLPVHELTLLKAFMRIAARLGCDNDALWSLDCLSPFNRGVSMDQIPEAWKPTTAQVMVPHHPVVDFLPWPTARDRLLTFMTVPDESRPPNARGSMALVNFVYDLEDNSEGVRIYGGDPCDPKGWEVGQLLFERWWFLFDRSIIETSNRWRQMRGAEPLTMRGPAEVVS